MGLIDDAGVAYTHNGHRYGPLTMRMIAEIQDAMDDADLRAYAMIPTVTQYCKSAKGIELALSKLAERHGSPPKLKPAEAFTVVAECVARFWGESATSDDEAKNAVGPAEPGELIASVTGG